MKILSEVESQIITNLNLINIAEGYCRGLYEESNEISAILSLLNIMQEKQESVLDMLDTLYKSAI